MEAFRTAWCKNLTPNMEITHNIIVHNLIYNFDVYLDMRMIKFVYNALNNFNEICHNLLRTKLNCIRSTFLENYQYLSYKYQLSDRDWYRDLEHLLGKLKKKFPELFLGCCCCLPTPMTLASGGSPMFPLVVHQPASPSIWPAVQSLRRGLSTNPGATMWCVCGCS